MSEVTKVTKVTEVTEVTKTDITFYVNNSAITIDKIDNILCIKFSTSASCTKDILMNLFACLSKHIEQLTSDNKLISLTKKTSMKDYNQITTIILDTKNSTFENPEHCDELEKITDDIGFIFDNFEDLSKIKMINCCKFMNYLSKF